MVVVVVDRVVTGGDGEEDDNIDLGDDEDSPAWPGPAHWIGKTQQQQIRTGNRTYPFCCKTMNTLKNTQACTHMNIYARRAKNSLFTFWIKICQIYANIAVSYLFPNPYYKIAAEIKSESDLDRIESSGDKSAPHHSEFDQENVPANEN